MADEPTAAGRPPLPKDFVLARGAAFAVVARGLEAGRVRTALRYVRTGDGWRKLGSAEARAWLADHAPEWRWASDALQAEVHGVPWPAVERHLDPEVRLAELATAGTPDRLEARAVEAARLLGWTVGAPLGVTGSVLLGAQGPASDLDLVAHTHEAFERARRGLRVALEEGTLAPLADAAWAEAWRRRAPELPLDEYIRHERRKGTRALLAGTVVDLSLVPATDPDPLPPARRKLGPARLAARVREAGRAFEYPARYAVEGESIAEIVSFTATYVGQAEAGETVEAAGLLEEGVDGVVRLILGADREAAGAWLRVRP